MKRKLFLFIFSFLFLINYASEITTGKTYTINSVFSKGKAISVRNSSLATSADIVTWTETNVNSQRWIAEKVNENFYTLTNAYTGQALQYSSTRPKPNDRIIQNTSTGNSVFQWEFVPVNNPDFPNAYFIRYSLKSSTDDFLYLEQADNIDGSFLRVQLKIETADSIRQIWKVEEVETILNQHSTYVREELMNGWKEYYYKKSSYGYVLGNGGWWGDAEMIETVLDAFETTGDPKYKDMFTQLYVNFTYRNKTDWTYNEFNDDIAWMVLAAVRGYLMFDEGRYLNHAKNNFDKMYERALLPSGMLRWKQTPLNNQGTNSCINGPAEVAACYLGIATGDDSYFEKAKNLYALQRQYLYEPATGKVFDSGVWEGSTFRITNHWVSTYNQGTSLGAALMLYKRYGDEMYKNDAHKIVELTKRDLCDEHGVVKVCGSGNDLQGFKGILMRYLRRYIVDLAQPNSVEWLQRNALHAFNNRNSKRISWTAWWEKSAENFVYSDGYNFVNQPFGASTAISAAFNAPVDKNLIIKNAYSTIEAEQFDYLKGVLVEENSTGSNGKIISNILNNYNSVYANVDFGNENAISASFRVLGGNSEGSIEIRIGSAGGQLLGTAIIPAGNDWQTISCDISTSLLGMQKIVLVYKGKGFKLDNFQFFHSGTGLKLNFKQANLEIYPNPASEIINIESEISVTLNIFNISGTRVYSEKISQGISTVNVGKYSPGYYFVSINSHKNNYQNFFLKK